MTPRCALKCLRFGVAEIAFVMALVVISIMVRLPYAEARANQILTFQGLGTVRIGMTVDVAESALGARFNPMDRLVYSKACWFTERSDRVDPDIQYMIQNGEIVRIDVAQLSSVEIPSVTTSEGIGINSTEADIRRAYGNTVTITRAPYFDEESEVAATKERERLGNTTPAEPPIYWMHLDGPDQDTGIIFEVQGGRVIALRTGLLKAINLMEGCI